MKQIRYIYIAMVIIHVILHDDYSEKSNDYFCIINLLCLFITALSAIFQSKPPNLLRISFNSSTDKWCTYVIISFMSLGIISSMIIDSSITTLISIIQVNTSSPNQPQQTYKRSSWRLSFIFPATWCLLSYIMLSPSISGQLYKNNFQYFRCIRPRE
jgi:hypothetical protein